MSYLVNLVRSHIVLWRVRHFVRRKLQFVEDAYYDDQFWEKGQNLCSKFWPKCKCLQNAPFLAFILKSLLGFIGGALLVFLLLLILAVQVRMGPLKVAALLVLLSPVLTLGLAFSQRFRCGVLLLLPQLASKRGRQALVAFAFILALNGPVANTVYNMEETAHSLTCTLKLTGKGFSKIAEIVERPIETAKRAVNRAMDAIKASVNKIKDTLAGLQRVITAIGDVFKSSVSWLKHVTDVCNSEFGTPIERCYHLFEKTSKECSATMGPKFSWLCSVVYAGSLVCNTLTAATTVCVVVDPVAEAIVESIEEMRAKFLDEMDALFFVEVDYDHEFNADYETDNRTVSSMLKEMKAELKEIYHPILLFYKVIGGLFGLTWIIVFYKAYRYHEKYKKKDRFDNFYLTKELREIDLARIKQGKEPILPLRISEKRLYSSPGQLRLLRSERKRLFRSLIFLFLATLNIVYYLGCDYSLFWILDLIRRETVLPDRLPEIPAIKLQVDGDGLIPEMFRNLSDTLSSPQSEDHHFFSDLHPSSCLPNPIQPDLRLYIRIGSILILAWIFAFLEPFILRLRPHVLNLYYPERARARAVWLTAHILRERGGLLRDIGRLTGVRKNAEPLSKSDLIEKLKDRFWLARLIFGGKTQSCCVVCATAAEILFECEALGCNAIYCEECFQDRRNVCIICEDSLTQVEVPGLVLERYPEDEEMEEENHEEHASEVTVEEAPEDEQNESEVRLADEEPKEENEEEEAGQGDDDPPRLNLAFNFMNSLEEIAIVLMALAPRLAWR